MIPRALSERLSAGNVIPFVGAGVSMTVKRAEGGGRLFPSWRELLLCGAKRLEDEGKSTGATLVRTVVEDEDPDFLYAAKRLREKLGPIWSEFLREQIDVPRAAADSESLALARAVWALGSRLIVTTNYDQVLRWACPRELRDDLGFWDIEATAEQAQFLREGPGAPTVWHLHGQIRNAARLILTPDGYRRLYGEGSEGAFQAALQALRNLLASRSFLFIGFSLDDKQFGVELQGVADIFEGFTGPHYALVRKREAGHLKRKGLPVEELIFEDFGAPLVRRVGELGKCAASGPTDQREGRHVEPLAVTRAIAHGADLEVAPETNDELGFLEKIADLEEGAELLSPLAITFTEAVNEMNEVSGRLAKRLARLRATGGAAGAGVEIVNLAATQLDPIADCLGVTTDAIKSCIEQIDPGVRYYLARAQSGEPIGGGLRKLLVAAEKTEKLVKAVERVNEVLSSVGEATRKFRGVADRIANALVILMKARETIASWRMT